MANSFSLHGTCLLSFSKLCMLSFHRGLFGCWPEDLPVVVGRWANPEPFFGGFPSGAAGMHSCRYG